MSDATTFLKERPVVAGGIVLAVALLAYLSSRKNGGDGSTEYQIRGNVAQGIDPNAAAIEQAAINAGSANLATIAQLAGLQDSNANALAGSLAQTGAVRDVSLAQTSAQRDVSLSSIAANLRAALFATEANRDTSLAQTAASVSINDANNNEALAAAQLSQAYQLQQLKAQQEMYALQQGTERFQIQAGKDIARAQANAGIVNGLFGAIGGLFGGLF